MTNFRFQSPFLRLGVLPSVLAFGWMHLQSPAAYADPKNASADAFAKQMDEYLANENNMDKLGAAIEDYFKNREEREENKRIEQQFKNPAKVDIGSSPVKGPADAKVTVIEFSDFQCPFCKMGHKTMDQLLKEYPKDVKLVFKNLPLPMHPEAKPAALAALAAGQQGKFWEFHDELFENQDKLGASFYEDTAKKLGLDVAKFKADMAKPELEKQIEADKEVAEKLNIRGTPGFLVNGVQVNGARPLPYFKQLVERWKKG